MVSQPPMHLFKIISHSETVGLMQDGEFAGSDDDRRDGFIHLSTADQLRGTLEKHFAGKRGLFALVCRLHDGAELRWEPARHGRLFPHLYRPLVLADDVVAILPVPDERGDWRAPELVP